MTNNKHKLRILWNSNAPFSISGYGQQTADILPLIAEEGYPVACSAFYGLAGGKLLWKGKSAITGNEQEVLLYPIVNHVYGSDAMVLHGRDFKADIVIDLQDIWALNPQDLQQVPRFIPYVPVDHEPIPRGTVANLRFANRVIAMSKFGQEEMAREGFASTLIPHAVDTKTFYPMTRPQRKQEVGIAPDTFIIGMVAANKELPPRKSFQEVMDAFRMFLEKVPKSLLYIHTNPDFPGGFPIKQYAKDIGIDQRLAFPDPYEMNFNTGKEKMNLILNTFDILVAPSVSEGFGIPVIEAMSTGIPVIVNNFSAQKELVQDGITGYKTKLAQTRLSAMLSQTGIPDTQDLYEKMLLLYRGDRKKMGDTARKFIEKNYDLEKTWKGKWIPFLSRIEREIYGDSLQEKK